MVVMDSLTKYVHFIGLSHPYSVVKVAALFAHNVLKLHGMPASIVSDKDPVFTGKFWAELFKLQWVQLAMSSAYHPQTNGQTKVVNKGLEQYLRSFSANRPIEWSDKLYLAEFWFNTNYHSVTKLTPYEAMYGFPPYRLMYNPSGNCGFSFTFKTANPCFPQIEFGECTSSNEAAMSPLQV